MSRAYLAEWLMQLCGRDQFTGDVDSLTTAELTQLILLFAGGSATPNGAA